MYLVLYSGTGLPDYDDTSQFDVYLKNVELAERRSLWFCSRCPASVICRPLLLLRVFFIEVHVASVHKQQLFQAPPLSLDVSREVCCQSISEPWAKRSIK